jgi:hypothetical protein
MTKREEQELALATGRIVARWSAMSHADRIGRLKAAGILDDAGDLSPRYRSSPGDEKPTSTIAPR